MVCHQERSEAGETGKVDDVLLAWGGHLASFSGRCYYETSSSYEENWAETTCIINTLAPTSLDHTPFFTNLCLLCSSTFFFGFQCNCRN